MTQVEKIKKEIERRIAALEKCGADKTEGYAGEISGLRRLLHFSNSLPQEKAAVWHNASEKPDIERYIFAVNINNIPHTGYYNSINPRQITKWAYVDDLLNTRKQEEVGEELKAEVQRWREHYIAVKEHGFQINLRDIETVAYHFAQWQKGQKERIMKALLDMEEDSVEVERKYGEGGRELYLKMLGILRTFEED